MPIQIPIEIGDVILTGKFKNHKVTVKEIGLDDHQLPTVNGKGIMKIRIEKLMKPKEPKKENEIQENTVKDKSMRKKTLKEMMDADDSYPVPKKPLVQSEKNPGKFAATVKIKKEDDRFWFYMQNANGTEANITNVGFETIEQARHAARMKAFTIIDDKDDKEEDSFNKRPESATDPIKPSERKTFRNESSRRNETFERERIEDGDSKNCEESHSRRITNY